MGIREGWLWALQRKAIGAGTEDLPAFLRANQWPEEYASLLSHDKIPLIQSAADLQEEANRLGVTVEFLGWLGRSPTSVCFDRRIIVESRSRCPQCKEFFRDGETIMQRVSWWYHPACAAKLDTRKANAEHAPHKSNWVARGRVIRKGGGL